MIYPDTITVVRAASVIDPYSGESTAEDWTNATRVTYGDVQIQYGPTAEPLGSGLTVGRDQVSTGWTVYTKPGTSVAITAKDRVEWSGASGQLEVDGDVASWNSPVTGAFHHQVIRLRRTEG